MLAVKVTLSTASSSIDSIVGKFIYKFIAFVSFEILNKLQLHEIDMFYNKNR